MGAQQMCRVKNCESLHFYHLCKNCGHQDSDHRSSHCPRLNNYNRDQYLNYPRNNMVSFKPNKCKV